MSKTLKNLQKEGRQLRPYQQEAILNLENVLISRTKDGKTTMQIPTGFGKTGTLSKDSGKSDTESDNTEQSGL